jgi:hypothetical protein
VPRREVSAESTDSAAHSLLESLPDFSFHVSAHTDSGDCLHDVLDVAEVHVERAEQQPCANREHGGQEKEQGEQHQRQ